MSEEISPKDYKICLIPIDAQPPTFGMVYNIMKMKDRYDEIVICLRENPVILPTNVLLEMFSSIFTLPKFMVISHPQDFETVVELPDDLPYFNYIATDSDRVYVNLATKGYGIYLMPRAMGYDPFFHRVAWMQSNALDALRSHTRQISFERYKKETAPSAEEGDD